MYKNTGLLDLNFKLYIDDLYNTLNNCKLYNNYINITLTKNQPNYLIETYDCYILFIIYINNNTLEAFYNFIKLYFSIEIFNSLIDTIEIDKFLNNKNYGLIAYICDSKNISENSKGGFLIVYNTIFNIDIIENKKEIFSSSYYF